MWRRIAKLDDVQNYVESVTKSYCSSERTEGVGAERTCEVRGLGTLREKIIQCDDGESLAYTVEGMPSVVRSARSRWTVKAITPFKTRVSVRSTVETRYGFLGAAMASYVMKPKMTRLLEGALKSFKHFVESSAEAPEPRPPAVHAQLARARDPGLRWRPFSFGRKHGRIAERP